MSHVEQIHYRVKTTVTLNKRQWAFVAEGILIWYRSKGTGVANTISLQQASEPQQ